MKQHPIVANLTRPGLALVAALAVACGGMAGSPGAAPPADQDPEDPANPRVTVVGELTDEGVECQALRGDDGALYTLAGGAGVFGPGDRVEVRGTVARISTCMQGTTLAVEGIEAAPAED